MKRLKVATMPHPFGNRIAITAPNVTFSKKFLPLQS